MKEFEKIKMDDSKKVCGGKSYINKEDDPVPFPYDINELVCLNNFKTYFMEIDTFVTFNEECIIASRYHSSGVYDYYNVILKTPKIVKGLAILDLKCVEGKFLKKL